jgi:ribosome-associated translation inhibitor RaiA
MQIQINTDRNIQGHEDVTSFVEGVLTSKLGAVSSHLTRIEVHLADESATRKTGDDKRCTVEARPENRAPLAVTHHADTLQSAVTGAVDKMRAALDREIGKMRERR